MIEQLKERDMLGTSAMICNCGLPDEKVYPTLEGFDPEAEDTGYFATIIAKTKK